MRQFVLVVLCLLLGLLSCRVAPAQTFTALVDPAASSSNFELDSELKSSGTLRGNFDADTNPAGTQTRLGLVGGSGNMPIPTSLDLLSGSGGSSAPAGSFALALDLPALEGTLSGLALELAPGAAFPSAVSARLSYQTFRTLSPSCTFISVGAVTLPIGEIGQIRDITLLQTEDVALQIQATTDPDVYTIEAAVPALLSLLIETSLGDDPLPLSDLPVLLPLSGDLERFAPDRFEFRLMLEPQVLDGSLALGAVELPPIPLPLPCVLPPGPEANLVLNLNADALEFELELGFEVVAEAIRQSNGDLIFGDAFEQR
ncbi:MAG: hypothetical protein ACXIUM_05835 [Wenzhouxiangella sp.]